MLIKSSNLGVKNVHLKLNQLLFSFKYMLLYLAQKIIQKLEFFSAIITPPIFTSPAHCYHWATILCSQLWDHMRLHTMPSVHLRAGLVQHRRWILLLTLCPACYSLKPVLLLLLPQTEPFLSSCIPFLFFQGKTLFVSWAVGLWLLQHQKHFSSLFSIEVGAVYRIIWDFFQSFKSQIICSRNLEH